MCRPERACCRQVQAKASANAGRCGNRTHTAAPLTLSTHLFHAPCSLSTLSLLFYHVSQLLGIWSSESHDCFLCWVLVPAKARLNATDASSRTSTSTGMLQHTLWLRAGLRWQLVCIVDQEQLLQQVYHKTCRYRTTRYSPGPDLHDARWSLIADPCTGMHAAEALVLIYAPACILV